MPKKPKPRDTAAFDRIFSQPPDANVNYVAHRPDKNGSLTQRVYAYEQAAWAIYNAMGSRHLTGEAAFPFVYLARHALEIVMKQAIWEALRCGLVENSDFSEVGELGNIRVVICQTHDLHRLARMVGVVARRLTDATDANRQWNPHVEFLKDWEAADPDGAFFRYSRDIEGNVLVFEGNVYCGALAEKWHATMNFLHGILDVTDQWMDWKLESEREARQAEAEAMNDYRLEAEAEARAEAAQAERDYGYG